jgi:hypothetical protein
MSGVVDVKETQRIQQKKTNKNKVNPIPDYPVDDKGNKLAKFPVYTLSNDEKFDIDMGWSPKDLHLLLNYCLLFNRNPFSFGM